MPTRNFSIRLDVKGEAAVRKALVGLGKDGQRALRTIERGGPKASKGLLAVDRASRGLQGSFQGLAARAGPLGAALGRIGPAGLAAAAGLGALVLGTRAALRGTRDAVEFVGSIADTAAKIGLSAEALQEYRFAAEQAGVAQNTLDMALQRFSRRVAEAVQGQGELRDTLKQYGVQVTDTEGRQRKLEDVIDDYADAIKGAASEQERLRLAFKGFDSEGAAVVVMLREGAEGLDRERQAARDLGGVFSNETVRGAKETKAELAALNRVMDTNVNRILLNLSPALVGVTDLFANLTSGIGDVGEALKKAFVSSPEDQLAAIEAKIAALKAAAAAPAPPAGQLFPSSAKAPRGRRGSIVGAVSGPGNPQRRPGGGGGSEITILERQAAALREILALKREAAAAPATTTTTALALRPEAELRAEENLRRYIDGLGLQNELLRATGLELSKLTLVREQDLAVQRAETLARQANRELGEKEIKKIRAEVAARLTMKQSRQDLVADLRRETKATRELDALRAEGKALLAGVATETERMIALDERLNELVAQGALGREEANEVLRRTKDRMGEVTTEIELQRRGLDLAEAGIRGYIKSWDDLGRAVIGVLQDILAEALRGAATMGPQSSGGGLFGGLFGGGLGFSQFLFRLGGSPAPFASAAAAAGLNPTFAHGGRPPLDRVSIVGERGPEWFVPDTAGTIIPNGQLGGSIPNGQLGGSGGGGHTVIIENQNFDFRGAEPGVFARAGVFKEEIKRETIAAVVELLNSGGVLARASGRR